MEVIFANAKQHIAEMSNKTTKFTCADIKWKDHLLKMDLSMDEERWKIMNKGKVISPNAYFLLLVKIMSNNWMMKRSPL